MSYPEKPRSNVWFLLPIFFWHNWWNYCIFSLYVHDDPRTAKNCLYLGLIMMVIGIILNIFIASSIPGLDSGFNVNI